jgi:hypothetical protein
VLLCNVPKIGKVLLDDALEEEFGSSNDSGQGAWSDLSKEVVSNLSKSVVSLASLVGNCIK